MITNAYLVLEVPHCLGNGVQRIYRFPSGKGLSLVNARELHSYSYAWEAAVLHEVQKDGSFGYLDYETPLTSDVEVFMTDEEANEFIQRASTTI